MAPEGILEKAKDIRTARASLRRSPEGQNNKDVNDTRHRCTLLFFAGAGGER